MIVGGGVLPAVRADLDASVPPDESLFRRNRIVVVDEAWRVLSNLACAEWLQDSFKHSCSYGVQNIVVMHRLSDLAGENWVIIIVGASALLFLAFRHVVDALAVEGAIDGPIDAVLDTYAD